MDNKSTQTNDEQTIANQLLFDQVIGMLSDSLRLCVIKSLYISFNQLHSGAVTHGARLYANTICFGETATYAATSTNPCVMMLWYYDAL